MIWNRDELSADVPIVGSATLPFSTNSGHSRNALWMPQTTLSGEFCKSFSRLPRETLKQCFWGFRWGRGVTARGLGGMFVDSKISYNFLNFHSTAFTDTSLSTTIVKRVKLLSSLHIFQFVKGKPPKVVGWSQADSLSSFFIPVCLECSHSWRVLEALNRKHQSYDQPWNKWSIKFKNLIWQSSKRVEEWKFRSHSQEKRRNWPDHNFQGESRQHRSSSGKQRQRWRAFIRASS